VEILFDQLVNGLTLGAEYALLAAGLSLIFGVVGIVNFAQGDLYMVGAYALYAAELAGAPYPLAVVLTVVAMLPFGALFYLLVLHRAVTLSWQSQLIATLSASIILQNAVTVVAGGLPVFPESPLVTTILTVGVLRVSYQRLVILAAALLSFAALFIFLQRTKLGKSMRAVAQNQEACGVVGIPVRRVALAAVVIGTGLAGVASATIPVLSNVYPTMGLFLTLKAFAAVVMGGFGNVQGAIVSAFALGMVEALGTGYISSAYGDAFVFGVMIAVLMIRPRGLFGRAVRVS
jgi:branched-chain amino acid transport system permease protein